MLPRERIEMIELFGMMSDQFVVEQLEAETVCLFGTVVVVVGAVDFGPVADLLGQSRCTAVVAVGSGCLVAVLDLDNQCIAVTLDQPRSLQVAVESYSAAADLAVCLRRVIDYIEEHLGDRCYRHLKKNLNLNTFSDFQPSDTTQCGRMRN